MSQFSVPPSARRASGNRLRRVLAACAGVLVALTVLGGCARVQVALTVQPDDTVSGTIVVATPRTGAKDTGPPITLPSELADAVDTTPYDADGYVGQKLSFSGLSFEQVSMLPAAAGPVGENAQLTLRRVGNRVLVNGAADLRSARGDLADFRLKMLFPGEILETDGEPDANTVSWKFEAGEKSEIQAVAGFVDPQGPSTLVWSLALGLIVAGVSATVVWLAREDRNPPIGPPIR